MTQNEICRITYENAQSTENTISVLRVSWVKCKGCTNETGPLPLCTFSVMGLSMCSSIFSESSPVRSKSCIINELSGFPNSVLIVRCSYASSSWCPYRSCILHLLCRKTLVFSADFGTKIKFDLSTFIQKLLVFIKNYSTIHRSDKMKAILHTSKFWYRENLTKAMLDKLTRNGVTP